MHERLLEVLACPYCGSALEVRVREKDGINIKEGALLCSNCFREYEIKESIVDFLGEEHKNQKQSKKKVVEWKTDKETWDTIVGSLDSNYDLFVKKCRGDFILDWAGGNGWKSGWIKQAKSESIVINMDPALDSLSKSPEGVERVRAVGEHLPFKTASIGGIHARAAFHHVSNLDQCLKEMNRVTMSGAPLFTLEPLNGNPISKLARRLVTTPEHDPEEKPLNPGEFLEAISSYFNPTLVRYHFLTSYLMPHIVSRIPLDAMRSLSKLMLKLDQLTLSSLPGLRRHAEFIEIIAEK